jgi:hypothetical protein
MKIFFFLTSFFFLASLFSGQVCAQSNLIVNGDMEEGRHKIETVAKGWSVIEGSPDLCSSDDDQCHQIKESPGSCIGQNSPQGGAWTRIFHSGAYNERFGQKLLFPMVKGNTYALSFYASFSQLNETTKATQTGITVAFMHDNWRDDGEQASDYFHKQICSLTTLEEWVLFEFTFDAKDDFDYIVFSKSDIDLKHACYIEDVKLIPTCLPGSRIDTSFFRKGVVFDYDAPKTKVLWHDGNKSSKRTLKKAGTYLVTISANGCSHTDTIVVKQVQNAIIIGDVVPYPDPKDLPNGKRDSTELAAFFFRNGSC